MWVLEVLDASDNALMSADVSFDDLMDEIKDVVLNFKVLNLRGNVVVIDGLEGWLREVVDVMVCRGVKFVL